MMNNIFVKKNISRVPMEIIQRASDIPTSILSDCDTGSRSLDYGIRAMVKGSRITGSALTVKLGYRSNLLLHAAMNLAKPGDVLMVDTGGDTTAAVFGEIMSTVALATGIAGLVVDGLTRDTDRYEEVGFSIFARGCKPCVFGREPTAGSINLPIECGGVPIEAGDLIVADDDGVVAIKHGSLESTLEKARQKLSDEKRRIESIKAGSIPPVWLEAALTEAAITYLD